MTAVVRGRFSLQPFATDYEYDSYIITLHNMLHNGTDQYHDAMQLQSQGT